MALIVPTLRCRLCRESVPAREYRWWRDENKKHRLQDQYTCILCCGLHLYLDSQQLTKQYFLETAFRPRIRLRRLAMCERFALSSRVVRKLFMLRRRQEEILPLIDCRLYNNRLPVWQQGDERRLLPRGSWRGQIVNAQRVRWSSLGPCQILRTPLR